ncbi:hypothetical protein JS518_15400 [Clostridiales bacterium FE2010]|nr:hypothetical protein JS518_15400 [Clostridiales bacterium FE2010]
MLRLSIRNFGKLCRNFTCFFILSFLCLTCAFMCFLLLQEKGYNSYLESIKQYAETQTLFISAKEGKTIEEIYKKILNDNQLPSVGIVTISNNNCSGVYWDRNYDPNVWYTPSGRFFSDEEMISGADVALLSMSYMMQHRGEQIDKIWENGISLEGNHFNVIGNYEYWMYEEDESDYETLFLPTLAAIPINTFLKLNMQASYLRLIFSRSLSQNEISIIQDLIDSLPNVNSYTMPQTSNTLAFRNYMSTTGQYILILIMSLISIISIILYWTNGEIKRYKIYMLCGSKKTHIVFLMSMTTFLLVTTAYLVSVALVLILSSIISAGILAVLPWSRYLIIYCIITVFLILAVNIKAIPVLYSDKDLV